MPLWLRTTGLLGSIAVLIALIIAFFKQLVALVTIIIGFIGVITFAIKALIIFAFLALFIGVAVLAFRAWQGRQNSQNKS